MPGLANRQTGGPSSGSKPETKNPKAHLIPPRAALHAGVLPHGDSRQHALPLERAVLEDPHGEAHEVGVGCENEGAREALEQSADEMIIRTDLTNR
jgi:hypothetical protein